MKKSKSKTKSMVGKIEALVVRGWKAKDIAEKLNVSPAYVYIVKSKHAKKALKGPPPSKTKAVDEIAVPLGTTPVIKVNIPDMVNHPPHYTVGGIETLDFIEAKGLGYNLGNAVKYISRAEYKSNKLEDLEKARFYLNREIEKQTK